MAVSKPCRQGSHDACDAPNVCTCTHHKLSRQLEEAAQDSENEPTDQDVLRVPDAA